MGKTKPLVICGACGFSVQPRKPSPMKPYYEEDGIVLYHADWRDVPRNLLKCDHVISDPPYSANTHKNAKTNHGRDFIGRKNGKKRHKGGGSKLVDFDHITDEDFCAAAKEMIILAERWVVMTCDHRHAYCAFDWPEFVRLGAWIKVAPMPQISGDRPGSGHESILLLHKAGRTKRWNGGGKTAIYTYEPERKGIPTQKPLPLVHDLVNDFTDRTDTILDPFCGAGTTLLACKDLARKAIGCELVKAKCDRIVERLRQSVLELGV